MIVLTFVGTPVIGYQGNQAPNQAWKLQCISLKKDAVEDLLRHNPYVAVPFASYPTDVTYVFTTKPTVNIVNVTAPTNHLADISFCPLTRALISGIHLV